MKRNARHYYSSNQTRFDFGAPETDAEREARERAEARDNWESADREARERAERVRQAREKWERAGREERQRQRSYRPAAKDPYSVLGILVGATQREIRSAWIALVQRHHPDHGGDAAMFREVQGAFERLRQSA